jgi:hypothetical protein
MSDSIQGVSLAINLDSHVRAERVRDLLKFSLGRSLDEKIVGALQTRRDTTSIRALYTRDMTM